MSYDPNNVFARILRGELPKKARLETEHTLIFEDIHPQAEVHLLAIPKGAYVDFLEFSTQASDAEIVDFVRAVGEITTTLGLGDEGFRVLANAGERGRQEVPHFHLHLFGGEDLGRMIRPPSRRSS